MDIGKGGASLAIQPGGAAVGFGAGLLAVIAAHAQRFVDQQHIGGFTQTLAYQEGDVREALDIHLHFLELNNSLYTTTNPIPIKTALSMMGVMEDNFRLPMTKMDDKKRNALEATLREYELIPRRKG